MTIMIENSKAAVLRLFSFYFLTFLKPSNMLKTRIYTEKKISMTSSQSAAAKAWSRTLALSASTSTIFQMSKPPSARSSWKGISQRCCFSAVRRATASNGSSRCARLSAAALRISPTTTSSPIATSFSPPSLSTFAMFTA